jgi:Tfp pilus assembly protein PilF
MSPRSHGRLLTWLLLLCGVFAQGASTHKLEIHVTLTTGVPISSVVRVQVLDLNGTPIAEAYTNRKEGVAEFQNFFSEGTYRLLISGANIETTTAETQIVPTETDHREYVRVKSAEQRVESIPGAGNSSVSVETMGVPEKAKDAFNKGVDYYAKGESVKAKREFAKAIAIYPQYARAHNNLGVLYLKENDKTRAKDEFATAIRDDANLASAYINLAKIAISDKQFPEAENKLNKAISLDPTALNALALLTSAEYANEEYDKALATVNRIHSAPQHEQYGEVHLFAGEIYLKRNQPDKGLSEFQLFLKERPEDQRVPEVKMLIARLQTLNK